jgi:hypothetical protein
VFRRPDGVRAIFPDPGADARFQVRGGAHLKKLRRAEGGAHGIHQLNTPSLGFAGKSLERRLWHQWDVGSTCLGRRSRWSADERPTWWSLYRQQTTAFKINLSFGFILRNIETGVLRHYHSSQNNARFFDVPHLIRTEEDLDAVISWSVPLLDRVAGRLLCTYGLPMLSIQHSGLWVLRQHVWSNRILNRMPLH